MNKNRCSIDKVPLGWLTPDGDLIRIEYGEHTDFAYSFCEQNGIELEDYDDPEIYLLRHDFVLIHFPAKSGSLRTVTVECDYSLTEAQEHFLTNYSWDYDVETLLHCLYGRDYF